MSKSGVITIHGKEYKTVALRVSEFRKEHGNDLALITEILEIDTVRVCMKASIVDKDDRVIATGHAEEFRSSSMINKTSALENCETSAIGRALASLGLGGSEYASANEVQGAIAQQQNKIAPEKKLAIEAYLEKGWLELHQLERAFGHAVIGKLLDVEADRIINGVMKNHAEEA